MHSSEKIHDLAGSEKIVKQWQLNGLKIAFTNGCFDILHIGHVDYLEKARKLGDRLVLGLNTDDSVSRIKGPDRPIVNQESRSRVIAALEFVDLVVFFEEDTPLELIQKVRPDVLVKGDDYEICNIVGADFVQSYGGKVTTIPLIKGYSTTNIIEKIKNLNN
jgi:D-glycero-beta-D-manno-heptose 1-phosphate adenylyltransferase